MHLNTPSTSTLVAPLDGDEGHSSRQPLTIFGGAAANVAEAGITIRPGSEPEARPAVRAYGPRASSSL